MVTPWEIKSCMLTTFVFYGNSFARDTFISSLSTPEINILKKTLYLCCDRGATSGSNPRLSRHHPWCGRSWGSEEWTADRWWSHQGPRPHVEVQQNHASAERTPPHDTEFTGGDCWPGMYKILRGPPHLIFFCWNSLIDILTQCQQ